MTEHETERRARSAPPAVIVTDAETITAIVEAAVAKAIAKAFAEGQRSTLPAVMNVAEAARRMGVSRERLDAAITAGRLPCKRVGARVLVTAADVTTLLTPPPSRLLRGAAMTDTPRTAHVGHTGR